MNLKAYRAIEAEAARLGLPTTYKTDVTVHDRAALTGDDAAPIFVWVLRGCGTLLYRYDCAANVVAAAAACWSDRDAHWYIWDDDELLAVTPDDAVAELAESLIGQPVYETMYGYAVPNEQIGTVTNVVVGLPHIRILTSNNVWVDLNTEFGLIVV